MTAVDPNRVQIAAFVFDSSTPLEGGTFTIDKTGVAPDDWDAARAPERTEEERRQIVAGIESGDSSARPR